MLSSLLNFNPITVCQVGVCEIASRKWFGGNWLMTDYWEPQSGAQRSPVGPSGFIRQAAWTQMTLATRQWQEPLPENKSKLKNGGELVPGYRQQTPRRIPRISERVYIKEDDCLVFHPSHIKWCISWPRQFRPVQGLFSKARTKAVQGTKI